MSGLKLKLKNKKLQETLEHLDRPRESVKDQGSAVLPFPQVAGDHHHENRHEKLKVDLKYNKKQEKRKKSNKYFYRVSNHHELFKIGRSFYTDYLSGVKSFAITSTGYQSSQQKSILGLASFFDHKEDVKIGIVSDNLHQGAFKDIISISKKVNFDLFGLDHQIVIHSFFNHFEFINMDDLLNLVRGDSTINYEDVFDQVVDMYDVIFWDVPELHKIQLNAEQYFPVIMKFESISIIVAKAVSKHSDIDEIKRFFLGYGINLKGLLLADQMSQDEKNVQEIKSDYNKPINEKISWWKKSLFRS